MSFRSPSPPITTDYLSDSGADRVIQTAVPTGSFLESVVDEVRAEVAYLVDDDGGDLAPEVTTIGGGGGGCC